MVAAALARYSAENTSYAPNLDVPIEWVERSNLNPRKHFSDEALDELATSIKSHGLLEPLVVREAEDPAEDPVRDHPRYLIIAGERRYRACQRAGLQMVPVRIFQGVDDKKHIELALIENLHRQDLDPIEEAEGYRQLNQVCGLKQTEIATAVKRGQPAIAKAMSLLDLPEDVQEKIRQGQLSPTHGAILVAKYRGFPALITKLVALAIRNRWTSKDFEGDLPQPWSLEEARVVKAIYRAEFDTKVCQKCPFGAYRATNGGGNGYCLKPEHFHELQTAAIAEKNTSFAAQVEKSKEQAKAAGKGDAAIPRLDDLRYGTYRAIRDSVGDHAPENCTESCPCRSFALEGSGKLTPICTNPQRFQSLLSQQSRKDNKEARKELAVLLDQVTARIDGLTAIGPYELAIIARKVFNDYHVTKYEKETFERQGVAVLSTQGTEVPTLAQLDPLQLVKLLVEVILRTEIRESHEYGHNAASCKRASWYMSQIKAK